MPFSDPLALTGPSDEALLLRQLLEWQQQLFQQMVQGRDKLGLLNDICTRVAELLPDASVLIMKRRHGGRIEVVAAPALDAAARRQLGEMISRSADAGPCGAALAEGGLQVIEDVRQDPRWRKVRHLSDPLGAVGCWSHAIRDGEGEAIGVLAVAFPEPRQPDGLAERVVAHAAELAALVMHLHHTTQQMRQMVDHDPLTRLYSRQRLQRDVEGLFQRGEPFGCLYIDLDRFKDIIDTHGHGVGDRVLEEAARRLEACLVDFPGMLYRFGGDEFIIITQICGLPNPKEEMEKLCTQLLERLQAPLTIEGETFSLSASIGISCGAEAKGDFYELLRMADAALWSAKGAGRRTWRFYQDDMVGNLGEELRLETDLQRALREEELDVHYQPILDARTGEVVSFEALVRWNHPEMGMVRPDKFIAVAEKCGLIRQLDEKVLDLVLADLYEWFNALKAVRFTVAINLSALEFERQHIERLVEKVRDSNLSRYIEFEMTETLMMSDTEETLALIRMIRESGIAGLAMDDFGTGYSSIGYLKRFSVDKLKIDRSLVRDIETDPSDLAIARAVCALGRSLGLKVVAEGVETDVQRTMLVSEGVDLLQGYLFGKPMPGEAVVPWLESRLNQCVLVK